MARHGTAPSLNHDWDLADRGDGREIAGILRHGPECWDAGMDIGVDIGVDIGMLGWTLGCWGGHWDAGMDIGMLGWT